MNWILKSSVVSILLVMTACEAPSADRRDLNPPEWYQQLKSMNGVNLPHVPGALSHYYIDMPDFEKNLVGMGWNTFRAPISLSAAVDRHTTLLNEDRVEEVRQVLAHLIVKLRTIHEKQTPRRRMMLLLDFHQFKFGPVCGGDGVPSRWINEEGLNPDDNNCLFLAWERFWNNDRGVQDLWREFAGKVLRDIPALGVRNKDWLTIAIEPMNEPFAGSSKPILTGNLISTFFNLNNYMNSEQSQQIQSRLVPFYARFVKSLQGLDQFKEWTQVGLMVFEPFMLDLLRFKVVDPIIQIYAASDYSAAYELKSTLGSDTPLRWIAGPHHYAGGYDQAFRNFFPDNIKSVIDLYPNRVFNSGIISERFGMIKDRMNNAGMDFILGEYGTYTRLKDSTGNPGGYKAWIQDVQNASMNTGGLGALWWRYHPDSSDDLTSYDMLENKWNAQILKCESSQKDLDSIVRAVFGKCVRN